jgi:hypothetical protein
MSMTLMYVKRIIAERIIVMIAQTAIVAVMGVKRSAYTDEKEA